MASIKLERLTKKFGKVLAVNNLNLEVRNGEFIALLGPSGCGKTTTLLMIAGLYRPTEGKIYFDDVLVNDVPPKDRYVGLVFQSYALYPHMKVYENIAFPLKLAKVPQDEIDRKVREVAELTQIEDLLDRMPSQLSGGQQQRVALCRALVKEPEILLLDEPLSNLDARLRIETRAELKRLQRELRITTILVTHDQVEALAMSERVAVMHLGTLQQYGPPDELYDRPRNLFVASFIGDPPMNLIPVKIEYRDGRIWLVADSFALPLAGEWEKLVAQTLETSFILGLRPEDVRIYADHKPNALLGEVFLAEPLGGGMVVHLKFGEITFRALAPREIGVKVGGKFWIVPDQSKLHLFTKDGVSVRELGRQDAY